MNWKPTLWKSIISIILAVLATVLYWDKLYVCIGGPCAYLFWERLQLAGIIFVPVLLVVYAIWSLFEKKN